MVGDQQGGGREEHLLVRKEIRAQPDPAARMARHQENQDDVLPSATIQAW